MVGTYDIQHELFKNEVEKKMIPSSEACERLGKEGLTSKFKNQPAKIAEGLKLRQEGCQNKRLSGIMIVIGLICLGIGGIITLYYAFDTVNQLYIVGIGLTIGLIVTLIGIVLTIGGYISSKKITKGLNMSFKFKE